jgi:hypothetical protein
VSVIDEQWLDLSWAQSQKPHLSQRTREMGHPAADFERTGVGVLNPWEA